MILAVIPARMGSQRMPGKNLCEIEPGLSLIKQAASCVRGLPEIHAIAVSSDDESAWIDAVQFVKRPAELSGPLADITDAVKHATEEMEARFHCRYDYVVTLQPAVIARSPLIVRQLVEAVTSGPFMGGITMAATHRWIWESDAGTARNDWFPGPYPRSQDGGSRLVEINAVQVAHRSVVADRKRWGTPLAILELPSWCAALDIDTPNDLSIARDLWPWAKTRLETYTGPIHRISDVAHV